MAQPAKAEILTGAIGRTRTAPQYSGSGSTESSTAVQVWAHSSIELLSPTAGALKCSTIAYTSERSTLRARLPQPWRQTSVVSQAHRRRTRPDSTDRVLQFLRVALAQPEKLVQCVMHCTPLGQSTANDNSIARWNSHQPSKRFPGPAATRHASRFGRNTCPMGLNAPRHFRRCFHSLGLPAQTRKRTATALPHIRLARDRANFYLQHTPTLRHLKHLADHARHRIPLRQPQCFPL